MGILLLSYLLCHGLALMLLPEQAELVSFVFLIGAPLLAMSACFWRSRQRDASSGWSALVLAMSLWAGGMAVNMLEVLGEGDSASTPWESLLLYALYGVPVIFILARTRHEMRKVSLIDVAMAVMMGYLFFVHISHLDSSNGEEQRVVDLRLMFDIENLFIAGCAWVRWFASEKPAHRHFFGSVAIYAVLYLLTAAYVNHFSSDSAFGAFVDLIVDVPFLVLVAMAIRGVVPAMEDVRSRPSRVVMTAAPMLLPLLLLVVSALIVSHHPALTILGFGMAMIGFGTRSTLLQLQLLERQDALDVLSRSDGLTGVANRRQFDQVLEQEWKRAQRVNTSMALLLVDIDHFKQFNDHFGHPAGDECLKTVARTIALTARRGSDLVARYGGEEFAVVLPASTLEGAMALAEQIRVAIARLPMSPATRAVTVSIGVGFARPQIGQRSDVLLVNADAALYSAKRDGRNQVALKMLVADGVRVSQPPIPEA